jgi:CBS domain-containing protein
MLDDATVADAMHSGLITCPADATVAEIAAAMARERIHCVIVTDGNGRRPWAVVSDLDLMGALVAGGDVPAASLAGTEVLTIAPAAPLAEAARLMAEHQVGHLVVLDPGTGHPIGVVSTLDVARAAA